VKIKLLKIKTYIKKDAFQFEVADADVAKVG
jgi:hypothetical protein